MRYFCGALLVLGMGLSAFADQAEKAEKVAEPTNMVKVDGTYFYNVNKSISPGHVKPRMSERIASLTANKFCQEKGYKVKLAFYFVNSRSGLSLTDVFCGNDLRFAEMARTEVMRQRVARNQTVWPGGKKLIKKHAGIEVTGFGSVDESATKANRPEKATSPANNSSSEGTKD